LEFSTQENGMHYLKKWGTVDKYLDKTALFDAFKQLCVYL